MTKQENKVLAPQKITKLLHDPVRFKIFTEIFFRKEATASELQKIVGINRSTLSFHLTKLVKTNILKVRFNPTGRSIKYYSLGTILHKIEFKKDQIFDSDKEKYELLLYLLSQMGFEFKLASSFIEEFTSELSDSIKSSKLKDVSLSQSKISFENKGETLSMLNGGIFYTSKDHVDKFISEIESVVSKFKNEVFFMHSTVTPIETTHAVVFGAFPLRNRVKIIAKKIKSE